MPESAADREARLHREAQANAASGAMGMSEGEDGPNSPVAGPVGGESNDDLMSGEDIAAANAEADVLREEDVTSGDRLDDRI